MQNFVFVLDTNKVPQAPVHPGQARLLLSSGQAAVYRRFPFTIILKRAVDNPRLEGNREPITVKVDPGSKTTGIALIQDDWVVFAAELEHRGQQIKKNLESRRAIRRNRRNRKTRYRQPRFDNRTKPKGWLAPSLQSRVNNLQTWLVRFLKLCNVQSVSMELVRFDTQLMQDAEISGVEYQQGELAGYEVREYLLEKFGRKCCYCGKTDVPLEIEHITPKSRGGSDRVSNLCLACRECNQRKGNQTAAEFGGGLLGAQVQAQAKKPLKDASAVNSVRWAIWRMFDSSGLPVEVGTGGRTKFNRTTNGYPKAHWIDAACVGQSGQAVKLCPTQQPLAIKAVGRGSRQMCHMNKYGFPRTSGKSGKRFFGFQTGDMVKAVVPSGKNKGVHIGKVAVRATGSFAILFQKGKVDGINQKYVKRIHAQDGYIYGN
ncbi:MAG: HNH endonuclease [Caldilinea sp. CFX5]|nr:HNH endonuclease [Caldilinea sp. CFX5]